MSRCMVTWGLEVHHIRRNGGNELDNAQVLCQSCHVATSTYGAPGNPPPDFSQDTKDRALLRAGHQCQCTKMSGCH